MAAGDPLPSINFIPIGERMVRRGFRCASRDINSWFERKALKEHISGCVRVNCAVEDGLPHRPIGFYALAVVVEEVSNLPGSYHPFRGGGHFSALQLVWLATDRGFVRRGLGERMVGRAITTFAQIGPLIALPHLIVVPDPKDHDRLTRFYTKLGFTSYKDGEAMFLPLQSAVQAVSDIEAELAAEAIAVPNPVEDLTLGSEE